jgi:Flp pilus assembly protein TadG
MMTFIRATGMRVRDFVRDNRGAAALEFALIVPVMVTMIFGAIEVSELVGADRRVKNMAAAVADVVARDVRVTNTEVNDVLGSAGQLMFPLATTGVGIRISSVRMTTPGSGEVLWSDANGMAAHAIGATIAIPRAPSSNICPGQSVLIADAQYTYRNPVGFVLSTMNFNLRHQAANCPRVIDPVQRDGVT